MAITLLAQMKLRVQQVRLALAEFALEVDFEVETFPVAIFGPSGAGKTSLLDLIAGLRQPDEARIQLDDVVLCDTAKQIDLPARERKIGYVPQDLALFPHLNVRQNISYGLNPHTAPDSPFRLSHVNDVLEVTPLLDRAIQQLSGGEKQRVALARALVRAPRLLLLDEPLASLDSRLKSRILPFLERIRTEFSVPVIYVTHDRDEVFSLCQEVIRLEHGQIASRGTPQQLLKQKD